MNVITVNETGDTELSAGLILYTFVTKDDKVHYNYIGHCLLYMAYMKYTTYYSLNAAIAQSNKCHLELTLQFIHSIGMCRMRLFLAVLRSFLHSSLLCTFSCHPSPPTILPSSLTSSCHLFLGLPLNLVYPKFLYNTLLGILFSSILCTCPN